MGHMRQSCLWAFWRLICGVVDFLLHCALWRNYECTNLVLHLRCIPTPAPALAPVRAHVCPVICGSLVVSAGIGVNCFFNQLLLRTIACGPAIRFSLAVEQAEAARIPRVGWRAATQMDTIGRDGV